MFFGLISESANLFVVFIVKWKDKIPMTPEMIPAVKLYKL